MRYIILVNFVEPAIYVYEVDANEDIEQWLLDNTDYCNGTCCYMIVEQEPSIYTCYQGANENE